MGELHTERLVLRRWCDDDREPFAALNADPAVVEHLPGPLSAAASDALVDRIEAHFAAHGFGFYAVEVRSTGRFIGFVGLANCTFAAAFTPAVEVGWRLARPTWGHGYATEAARAATTEGFHSLDLDEIVAFTAVANTRSRAVMQRLGMSHDLAENFDHPSLPGGHRLARHVLYRLPRPLPAGNPAGDPSSGMHGGHP